MKEVRKSITTWDFWKSFTVTLFGMVKPVSCNCLRGEISTLMVGWKLSDSVFDAFSKMSLTGAETDARLILCVSKESFIPAISVCVSLSFFPVRCLP